MRTKPFKVLITGANGFLGQHLIRLLNQEEDWFLISCSREESQSGTDVHRVVDIRDRRAVENAVRKERPDVIVHAAAMTQVDACETQKGEAWEINVRGTRYLLDAAKEVKASFLFVSTDFIFDGWAGPYREEDLPNPVNFYGLTKLAAELLVKKSGLKYSIARTVLVYGQPIRADKSNIVLWVKKSLEEHKNIRVVDDQWRTPTLVQDLAKGCSQIVKKWHQGENISPIYNISGKDMLTPYQIAQKTAVFFNLDKHLITRANAGTFSQTAKRPPKTGFIIEKAETELGYKPHSFEEGLAVIKSDLNTMK